MKKIILVFSLIYSFAYTALGQQKEFIISGHVSGITYNDPTDKVFVRLLSGNNSSVSIFTDSLGNYSFTKIITEKTEIDLRFSPPQNKRYVSKCPFAFIKYDINFEKPLKFILDPDSTATNIIRNISMTEGPMHNNVGFSIFFNVNSSSFTKFFAVDTILDCIVSNLTSYPDQVVEIAGYADSKEKNKQQLSEQRAEKVYNLLLKKGIDSRRILFKGYSDSIPVNTTTAHGDNKINNCKVDFIFKK